MAQQAAGGTAQRRNPASPVVRRRFWVNPGYQLRSLAPLGVLVVLYAVLLGGFGFFPLQQAAQAEPDLASRALLVEQLFSLHLRVWPLLGVAGLAAGALALRQSHRTAGPIYRLNRILAEMAQGESGHVRFREHDEFRDLAGPLSQVDKNLRLQVTRQRDVLLNLEGRLKGLRARAATQYLTRDELVEALEAILTPLRRALESPAAVVWGTQ